jgi:hypothetical protein
MDKKLLDSLNNLSIALQDISDSLKSKSEASSATAKAMKGGNFIKEIKEINAGVKQLQKDSKQILANQQTIMKMGKSKSKGADAAEGLGKDKQKQKNFKEGIGVILLLAVAVLALGIAFNLVGKVNFLSVIALSIALPLLAIGFAKVHTVLKQVGFDAKKDSKNFIIAIAAISLGITISSWILSMVTPVTFTKMFTIILISVGFSALSPAIYKLIRAFKGMSFLELVKSVLFLPMILPAIALGIAFASWAFQLVKPVGFSQMFTTIFIALAFTVISFGIRKLLQAFKGIGMAALSKSVIFLPLILPAIALGIALSSYALQLVRPISLGQFFTTIFIALAFTIIAFGIRKLMTAFKGLTPVEMLVAAIGIPVILVAISYAIALSSHAFSMIQPIGFSQFLTALGIAIVFIVISFAAKFIIKAVSKMKMQDVFKLPLFFVAVSIAIMLSSHILSKAKTIPFMTMLKIAIFSVVLAIAVIAIGVAMFALSKLKVGVKDAIMGALLIVIISVAIMLSSHILALGNYKKYPDWKWALGVGLSLLAFIPAILVLGSIAMSGFGALAILAGGVMILVVALAIVATSHILAMGKYNKYPPILWTLGVVAAMVPFALMTLALGAIAMTGIGLIAFAVGVPLVLWVAETIVDASKILAKGKYDNKGMLGWTMATVLLFSTFAPLILTLGAIGMAAAVISFFTGSDPFEQGRSMLASIAWSIVEVSSILSFGKYTGGPTKAWAEGVAIALGAFAPVYQMLVMSSIMEAFGGGGVGPDDFARAIKVVSRGIVDAAGFFAKNKAVFKNGPPKAWAEGVGLAIGAFAPVYKMLVDFPFSGGAKMSRAIITISKGVVDAAKIFATNKSTFDEGYPSKKWGEGVGAALNAFAPVFKALHEDSGWFTSGEDVVNDMSYGVRATAWSLTDAASAFNTIGADAWKAYPSQAWANGVKLSIVGFMDIFSEIEERGFNVAIFSMYSKILEGGIKSISMSAKYLWSAQKYFKFKLDKSWVTNLGKNVIGFASITQQLDKMLGFDEKTSIKSGGFMGVGASTTSTTTRKMKDVSIVNRVVSQIVETARILHINQKFFKFKLDRNWVYDLHWNLENYAKLTRILDKILTIKEVKTMSLGRFGSYSIETTRAADVGTVNRIVNQLVMTAGILWKNKKFFENKIDPSYVKNMATNIKDFAKLVRYLSKDDSLSSGGILSAFGLDPVSRAALGMNKMASAFDKLASSLSKFSSAIKSVDGQKVNMIRKLTGNIAILSSMDSKMFNNMLTVLEKRSSVFSKLLDSPKRGGGPNVGEKPGGGQREVWAKKGNQGPVDGKGESALQKLDRIAHLLDSINKNVDTVDDLVMHIMSKKEEKPLGTEKPA